MATSRDQRRGNCILKRRSNLLEREREIWHAICAFYYESEDDFNTNRILL
jgi:hypothetical protein